MALLKIAEAAELLKTDKITIYQLIKEEKLPAVKITKRTYRIREPDLLAYMAKHKKEETPVESIVSRTRNLYSKLFQK